MGIQEMHLDKGRLIRDEKVVTTDDPDLVFYCMLIQDNQDASRFIHIQKARKNKKGGFFEGVKGGIMIPSESLGELKKVIDLFYIKSMGD